MQRYEWVSELMAGESGVDVGCGSGYGTYFLATRTNCEMIGIDSSKDAINYAVGRFRSDNLSFRQMNALSLDFEDSSFEVAVAFEVIEHLNESDQMDFISEIVRVLKGNGRLFVSCPNSAVSYDESVFHRRELSKVELENLLRKHFRNVQILGQDVMRDGERLGKRWHENMSQARYEDFVISEERAETSFTLLAICSGPESKNGGR